MRRLWIGLLVGLVALGAPAGEAEADPAAFVAWDAPEDCPDRAAFDELLAKHLSAPPAEPLHVEITVEKRGRRFHLTMQTTSSAGRGERELSGRDCAVLAETAALTLALAMNPEGGGTVAPAAAVTEPRGTIDGENPPRPGGAAAEDGEISAETTPGRELSVDLAVRAMALGDVGSYPEAAPGVGGAIAVRLGRWRVEGYGSYWPEQTVRLEREPNDGGRLTSLIAGLRGCARLLGTRMRTGLCAGAEYSRINVQGFGGFDSNANSWGWTSLVGGPTVAFRLAKRLAFRLDTEIVSRPVRRPQIGFNNDMTGGFDVIHKPDWVGFRGSLGLELWFP